MAVSSSTVRTTLSWIRQGACISPTRPMAAAGEGALLGVGIPRAEQQPVRGVYRVDPTGGSIIRIVEDFEERNGLCLAENGAALFINDTARRHIRRFEVR